MKEITLTQGKVAMVDDADFESVNAFKWCALKKGRRHSPKRFYAVRSIQLIDSSWAIQYLHRFLVPGTSQIDHKDGNSLNNQRENLRPATSQQNSRGFKRKRPGASSAFRGVSWYPLVRRWVARINLEKKTTFLGLFTSEADAARAYDAAARKHYGEFASPNFL